MIKVAQILSFSGVGGAEQLVLSLCKFHDSDNFACVVAAPEEGVIWNEIREIGTPVYTGWNSISAVMQWADIVNLHWSYYNTELHSLIQSSGRPYVTTLHWISDMPDLPAITICVSQHTYDIQKNKQNFIVIPNGIDLTRFASRPKGRRDEVIITRICRPMKCALYFWPAIYKVLDLYSQARLWIVGNDNGYVGTSENVRFWGVRRDIPDILAETDIFAYTPYPNIGANDLVVMEASAMGVPSVVSDVNCVNESIEDGANGFLTPFDDKKAFIQRIAELVEDEKLRLQMRESAIRIAQERFDIRNVARLYETVYKRVLNAYRVI